MRKTIVSAAVAALFIVGAPIALAQDTEPDCAEATAAVVELEVEVRDLAARELVAEQDALASAEAALAPLRAAVAEQEARLTRAVEREQSEDVLNNIRAAIQAARDAAAPAENVVEDARAALEADSDALAGLRARLQVAVTERDEACDEPTTTTPPPPADEFDCGDFAVRADAQAKLNETLPEDPHKLDLDSDGIACEVSELTVPPTPAPEVVELDNDTTVVVPEGRIDTGGGPA